MNDAFERFSQLTASRRAIFPKAYIDQEIPDGLILKILENANWAPSHRKTEPWRFKIFKGASLQKLKIFVSEQLLLKDPNFPASKLDRKSNRVLQSGCVMAIVLHRDPEESVPEWEELAAVACAVQNIWLSCTSLKIGSYWSSPSFIKNANEFLGLQENEKCLGFFYMGFYNPEKALLEGERRPIEEKIEWM